MRDRQSAVLHQATTEPIVLLEESQPSYIIVSANQYQQLTERLALLEDCALGQIAKIALEHSCMVGTEAFTTALQSLTQSDY